MTERSTMLPCLTSWRRPSQVLMPFTISSAVCLSPAVLAARASLLNLALASSISDIWELI